MKNCRFLTKNGTWYEIEDGYWRRLSGTKRSGQTRSEGGKIVGEPTVEPGRPAIIEDDNVREGYVCHFLQTSNVILVQT